MKYLLFNSRNTRSPRYYSGHSLDKSKFFSKQSIAPVACILRLTKMMFSKKKLGSIKYQNSIILNPTLFPNQKDLICKRKISYLFLALSIEDFPSSEVDFFRYYESMQQYHLIPTVKLNKP